MALSEKKVERAIRDLVFPWLQALGTREGLEQANELIAKAVTTVYLSATKDATPGMARQLLLDLSQKLEAAAKEQPDYTPHDGGQPTTSDVV